MGLLPCAPMRLSDFNYDLPAKLIARYPPNKRRDSRLLHVHEELSDREFADLPSLLRPGDLLVFNDTRVIPARLTGKKATGGAVELLVERIAGTRSVVAHLRASKSPKPGAEIRLAGGESATVTGRQGDLFTLDFSCDVAAHLRSHGSVPLPPYLEREAEETDDERYQTVYARSDGAVAAPTAGLHFDEPMLAEFAASGINACFVTLHVGAGTFQSLREEDVAANKLHAERVEVGQEVCTAIAKTRAAGGRVIAIGTTSVRALEASSANGDIEPFCGETDLFIYPEYQFRCVDLLLTNFHLPQSSLLMLVAAFAGTERILNAYRHAVAMQYRFFSYGDSMLVTPRQATHAI
jgi:S-adenosylmethionine:tRNA ribosyltransferase-isomerase